MATRPLYVVLNELTAWRLLWSALRGRAVCVIMVSPLFPQLSGMLERVARRARASSAAFALAGRHPTLADLVRDQHRPQHLGFYAKASPWEDRTFRLEDTDLPGEDYSYAFRKLTANYVAQKSRLPYYVDRIVAEAKDADIIGVDDDARQMYEAVFGRPLPATISVSWLPRRALNAMTAIVMAIVGVWGVARRLRLSPAVQDYFVAVDWLGDMRDMQWFSELEGAGLPVLYVTRNRDVIANNRDVLAGRRVICAGRDGAFRPGEAFAAARSVVRDIRKLWRQARGLWPRHFYDCAALPVKRAHLRAQLNICRSRFYWSRDEYNVDHVLRTAELRRVGCTSMGMLHGLPFGCAVPPMWRHVSFDTLFVFGRATGAQLGRDWDKRMTVYPAGAFGIPRAVYARRLRRPKDRTDIAIFANTTTDLGLIGAVIAAICKAFPIRTVYLKAKAVRRDEQGIAALRSSVAGFPNLVDTTEDPYLLLEKVRFVLTSPSTVIVEALQLGCEAFVIDDPSFQVEMALRAVPGLCINTADQAVDRLKALEDGTARYPWDSYRDLVELDGPYFFDNVRRVMGLADQAAPTG
jgi:hypothetical protein